MLTPIQIVGSANVAEASYNRDAKTVEVKFHSGAVYRYSGVAEDTVLEWERAASSGQHFYDYIRMSHVTERVSP